MHLQSLRVLNFKNYAEGKFTFSPHINCIVGLNGVGKTNLLDAIFYLSMTKSYFNALDSQNICNDESFFMIEGLAELDARTVKIHCSLKKGEKKVFKLDNYPYEKMSEHLGKFPVVMIAPSDEELIRESHDIRRKFFDSIISQTDHSYLIALVQYNHYLKQRNALLKSHEYGKTLDRTLLAGYDTPLLKLAREIATKRQTFVRVFTPLVEQYYAKISLKREKINLHYMSKALNDDFERLFERSLNRDCLLQRTHVGCHKDEYVFEINDSPIKKFGSQGQQKSFLLSLKLAQFAFVKQDLGVTPLLLLDDIFDKLDDNRISSLLDIITSEDFEQIFITDAREERTRSLISNKYDNVQVLRIGDD